MSKETVMKKIADFFQHHFESSNDSDESSNDYVNINNPQGESDRMFALLPAPPDPSATDSVTYANLPGKSDRLFAPLPPPPESTRTNSPVYDFSVPNQEHLQGESDRMFAPLPPPPEPSVTDSSAYANIPVISMQKPDPQKFTLSSLGKKFSNIIDSTTVPHSHHELSHSKRSEVVHALLLFFGINKWYFNLCSAVSFTLFCGGVAMIALVSVHFEVLGMTTIAAGIFFFLSSLLLPCLWTWKWINKRTRCSVTPLLCFTTLLIQFHFVIVGALVVSVHDDLNCILSCQNCPNSTNTDSKNYCILVKARLGVLIVMLALVVVGNMLSFLYYTKKGASPEKDVNN